MASQIEQTLASLTALSEQYTAKIDGFFKSHDLSLQAFHSATLDSIEKAFRRFESNTLASRSPLKSLQKQTRRKVKKFTRSRKAKPKTRQPPSVIASTHRDQPENENAAPSNVPRPLPQQTLHTAPTKTESVKPVNSPPPSLKTKKCTATTGMDPSKCLTRSSSSFRSAVESPILDLPAGKTTEGGRQRNGRVTDEMNNSPEVDESQWEDCRSEPKQAITRSKLFGSDRGSVPVNHDSAKEEASTVDPVSGGQRQQTEDVPRAPSTGKSLPEATKKFPQPSDTEQVYRESSREITTSEEQDSNSHPSETGQLLKSDTSNEEEATVPIQRRKRGAQPAIADLQLAQRRRDLIRKDKRPSLVRLARDSDENRSSAGETSKHREAERKSENSANKCSSTTEEVTVNGSESVTNGSRPNKISAAFEFKAPKPRPAPTIPSSYTQLDEVQPAVHRASDIKQTPSRLIQRNKAFNVPKQNTVFQKHFAVDEGGKITDAGIGILSEIVATSSRANEPSILKTGEERALRGTKLFKPTTDIYSAQRKPALSRMPSIQKSNMSSRASLLSHTPGAHAPTSRLAKHPVLAEPSRSNLRESLAALKQPITDAQSTEPMIDGNRSQKVALTTEPNSLLRARDEQGIQILAGAKRLAFADEYKQLDGCDSQPARAGEPQTAPAKALRHPRVRRDTEKSALRRRIEEIRRKASTSTVINRTSRLSSEENGRSASAGNRRSGTSEVHRLASGMERTHRSPNKSLAPLVEREVVPGIPKPSSRIVTAGSSNVSDERDDAMAQERVSERAEDQELGFVQEKVSKTDFRKGQSGGTISGLSGSCEQEKGENDKTREAETEGEASGSKTVLSNLMSSVASLCPGASSILGVRTNEERREETDAEVAAKRQRLDVERREAERLARMEAQRAARQKEAEEKQRRAEMRRQLLAEAEKAKEEERKRKEEHRKKVKQQEEEQRKRKKLEEDRKKEERRRQVLEKKALNMELQWKRTKGADGKRQRQVKVVERSMTGLAKGGGLGGKMAKGPAIGRSFGKGISPMSGSKELETEDGRQGEENGIASYVMTPAKATVIEESDEETERRKHKVIPRWAGDGNLDVSARSQPDPDKVFVNMPMCNLREVFGSSKQYRTRSSSANWTQDRVTTSEMTKYKKAVDGFGEC